MTVKGWPMIHCRLRAKAQEKATMKVRRVTTGHNAQGKAVVASDTEVDGKTLDLLQGAEFHRLWGADVPVAAGDSAEQAVPHCKDPSRLPDPSTLRRWAQRRLLSVWCWLRAGTQAECFLRSPTIVAWDLGALCRVGPVEFDVHRQPIGARRWAAARLGERLAAVTLDRVERRDRSGRWD